MVKLLGMFNPFLFIFGITGQWVLSTNDRKWSFAYDALFIFPDFKYSLVVLSPTPVILQYWSGNENIFYVK